VISHAVIPAAGRGIRAYPRTTHVPKVLLEIGGVPLIERNITMIRDALGVREFTVIIGYMGERVRDRLGDGTRLGVRIRYLECRDVAAGLARGLLLAKDLCREPFLTVLGDEVYLDTNHAEIADLSGRAFSAVCAVTRTSETHLIRRNYSVRVEGDRIVALEEKPERIDNDLLGLGTYVFTPEIFEAIESTPLSSRSGRVELTDAIGRLASREPGVLPFVLDGRYYNVNTVDDYNYANYLVRAARFDEYSRSVVIPAFNEESSVGTVVRDFLPWVDEVFVVDNSSTDRTAEVAAEAGARVETVRLHGYGDTIRHGLEHANGDILVVVEADSSFRARDLGKMLEYLKDADMVVGTRTTREMVEQGTNMRGPVRWGNVIVAKLVEALWWGRQPRFTDVGCTYRALWREAYARVKPLLRGIGPELSPELMIAALQARLRVIEVPVSYHRRLGGESKHSANYLHISRTALRMLRTIARKRLERY